MVTAEMDLSKDMHDWDNKLKADERVSVSSASVDAPHPLVAPSRPTSPNTR